ncbi:hypothetical protein LTR85_011097 [Meristemomyces frigidus]|nr:hypothetical protein LTR85_011097 [Meristemomyces frigidus]
MPATRRAATEALGSASTHPKRHWANKEEEENQVTETEKANAVASQPATACARVLAVSELLDNIFVYLPERDIVLTQRVSRAFNESADTSAVKRRLFLLPDPTVEKTCWTFRRADRTITEDRQAELVEPFWQWHRKASSTSVVLNSLMFDGISTFVNGNVDEYEQSQNIVSAAFDRETGLALRLSAFKRNARQQMTTETRDMIISHPPITSATMKWCMRKDPRCICSDAELSSETGITYGQIFDSLAATKKQMSEQMGGPVQIIGKNSTLMVPSIIAPTEREWACMKGGKALFRGVRDGDGPETVVVLKDGREQRLEWVVTSKQEEKEWEAQCARGLIEGEL